MVNIDETSPEHIKIQPILEYRVRYERRQDQDFHPDRRDNRSNLLLRGRIGVQFSKDGINARIVYQHSNSFNWLVAGNGILIRSDLIEANIQFTDGTTKFTLGRQRFGIGNRRLIGELDWHNVANSFEGIRVEDKNLTLFLVRAGVLPTPSKNLLLAGLSYTVPRASTSFIIKADDARQVKRTRYTLALEGKPESSKNQTTTYQIVFQWGHESGKLVRAWAGSARLGYILRRDIEAFGEVNLASGGTSKSTNSTFDQLYPTGHDKIGLMDTTGWKNVVAASAGIRARLSKASTVKLTYSWLQLYDSKDAWYGVGGAPNSYGAMVYRNASGHFGRDLGQELDLDFSSTLRNNLSLSAGAGVFFPGRFVRSFSGSRAGNQFFGYVMMGYKF